MRRPDKIVRWRELAKRKIVARDRILYVCTDCAEECPETCGHFDPKELCVMPDGRWLCVGCYDNERKNGPPFRSLPSPAPYVQTANQ